MPPELHSEKAYIGIVEVSDETQEGSDYEKTDTIFYVRNKLETIIKEYNISPNQSIGFVADIKTMEYLMVDFIQEYKKYWGNDIDFDLPDNVDI